MTGPAGPATNLGHVSVFWRKLVTAFAVRDIPNPPSRFAALMLGSRERFKMVKFNAGWAFAVVMQFIPFWDRPFCEFVSNDVRVSHLLPIPHLAVTLAFRSSP